MKKRRVFSLFSLLLVSLLFSPHAFSQETPETVVRVAPRPLSDNDSHLKVDIVIENGQAVTGYQVMLQYDSDYIKYVDIDQGNYLPNVVFFRASQRDINDSLKAILFVAIAFPNQSEGDGVLATLTFEKIIDESSDLTLLDVTRLSHGVVDNMVALSSPQLKNSKTHVAIWGNLPVKEIVQATYSYNGVFLFREDPEPIRTLEEMVEGTEPDNLLYDLNGDEDITATDLAWMHFAMKLDVNDDKKINTQDEEAVNAALGKTGSRPEDVNGDKVVDSDDVDLVTTAILAVENLSRQLSNLPVVEVVQATYSHEGVFLFRKDPEPITTLEEMVRRGESNDLRYDLDRDEDITATDLAWMRFAVRLDVNDDEKIDGQDEEAVNAALGKTGSRPEDVNGDKVVDSDDVDLVTTAILAVENLSRQLSNLPVVEVVQATYSHEGVFLFREDPEPITTLEEVLRRGESGNLDYDLDRDGKITATDLAWMHFAMKLDVNDDKKINTQDEEAVNAALGKTGSRPEDVNGDRVVDSDDEFLVNTAILTVENLSRQWRNLPVVEVVQATYSHEGVFLFRKDPEPAVVTLEDMVRRGESNDLRYDLDRDGKITATDLAWMHFAVRLDVNDDEKIDGQDKEAVKAVLGKTGSRPEDVNNDKVVDSDDVDLVNTAIPWRNLFVVEVVQATYSHEGVFLFREDPEPAVVTLEEVFRRGESGNLRYDLDGDGKITATDLAWMHFAVRLDVNDDKKIDGSDEEAVKAVYNKTGSRPEDVNDDKVVDYNDVYLVKTAIEAVKNLSRQWRNLPVNEVVQATYSHKGVFLFRKDPDLRYDLDGDGYITGTDLLWMRLAVRLDVNNDGKIDWQDQSAVEKNRNKTGSRPEDVNGDGIVTNLDTSLVNNAIKAVNRLARPAVQVIWYHPNDVRAYDSTGSWKINTDTIIRNILEPVQDFYETQLGNQTFELLPNLKIIKSSYNEQQLGELTTDAAFDLPKKVFEDISGQSNRDILLTKDIYLVVVQSQEADISHNPGNVGAAFCYDNANAGYGYFLKWCPGPFTRIPFSIVATGNEDRTAALGGWWKKEATTIEDMKMRIAHELGHNFGLMHTFDPNLIMGYSPANTLNANDFTEKQKAWLRLSPAFNAPMARGTQDALFSFVNYHSGNQTLEIKVTTQNGYASQSVSQFVVENPRNADGAHEAVNTWYGTTPEKISYASWMNGTPGNTKVFIHTIDGHGHITEWFGTLQDLINQVVPAAPAPLHVSLLPERTGLLPNYPNPFNPETWIPYQLATPADVTLTIYDINGHNVRRLDLGHQRAGMYHSRARAAFWDGRNAVGESVASGLYFYTLTAGDFTATRKMLIRK